MSEGKNFEGDSHDSEGCIPVVIRRSSLEKSRGLSG
jgi:hypothetical protein